MADEAQIHRDLGRLEGRIGALEGRVAESDRRNEAAFAALQESLDAINQKLTESALVDASRVGNFKGAWWVLSALLAASSTIGGIIAWLLKSAAPPH